MNLLERALVNRLARQQCRLWLWISVVLVMLVVGCNPERKEAPSKPSESFDSVTSSGIRVKSISGALQGAVYRNGNEYEQFSLPETTGGGIAIIDMDRDGRSDALCAGGGYPVVSERAMKGYPGTLMRGLERMQFVSCGAAAYVDMSEHYSSALAIADYDSDGYSDILVTGYSGLQLFRNQGDGTFEKISCEHVGLQDSLWSASAAWLDADNDGTLDLYVAHYANWSFDNDPKCQAPKAPGSTEQAADYCGPRQYQGLPDRFYASQGDGSFRDVTEESGIQDELRGLGVLAADLDGDLDVDLYVANDVDPNLLYRNEGAFRFVEIARRAGVASNDAGIPEGSMGIAVGDFNGDTRFDLWVTNYQNEVGALYRNTGNLTFTYASHSARIPATDESAVGWGTAFVDLDLDGREDLAVVNGHIELYPNGSTFQQRPQILQNVDNKFFRLVPRDSSEFLSTPESFRSLALVDLDDDGRMDFVVNRMNADALCVRNETVTLGSYLKVRLVGTRSNRDAIGATVRLQIDDKVAVRQRVGGGTYAGTNDSVMHFGVSAEDAMRVNANQPVQLEVLWPSGIRQSVELTRLNQEVLVIEQE
jgi:hypothetical protein